MTFKRHHLLILPPLMFLGVFYFYPLASIFGVSFAPDGNFDLNQLKRLVQSNVYLRIFWFTSWQALLSTVATLILALPGAYVFARYQFKGKALINALTTVPFVLPTVVTAAAFQALLGSGGLINRGLEAFGIGGYPVIRLDQTITFFILAHIFYNYTVILRIVGGFWSNLPRNLGESAQMLGANPRKTFFYVTLPLLRPAILAATLLVFIFCFTSFGLILILGGPRLATIEVEIYRQAVHLFNLPMAAALSLIQIVFTFCLMAFYTLLERRTSVSMIPETLPHVGNRPQTRLTKALTFSSVLFAVILLTAPLSALFISALLTESGPGLTYFRALFTHDTQSFLYVSPVYALRNSLAFAIGAAIIALSLGGLATAFLARPKTRKRSWVDPLLMLPLSTSAVTLGFGFIIALDEPPLNLRTSLVLPAIAHALVAFPFVIRSLLPAWRSIPQNLRDAAVVLGADAWKVWRHVDWPVLSRAFAVAGVFAFAISMGEFGASMFVARPQTPTLPIAIYRFLGQPGALNYGQAMAMSVILIITTLVGFLVIEKIKPLKA